MSNGTTDDYWHIQCFSEERAYYSLLIVISIFIICINFDVIITMATNKSLQTKRNAFLASLSVSDLFTGLVSIPLHIASNCYYPPSDILIFAQAICFRFVAISTMLNILMITVERYFGIIYPIRYQFILTKTRTSILITCTWATSVSSALVSYSWLASVNPGDEDLPTNEEQFERVYFIFCFVAFFLLPLVIMTVLYTKMFRTISKARKLASKALTYRSQSPAARSPINIRVTRSRSISYGSFGDYCHTHDQNKSWSQSPRTRDRSRSHGSYGDHLTVHSGSRSRSQSPARFDPVDTKVTHDETSNQITTTVCRPQSPVSLRTAHEVVSCYPVSNISCSESNSAHAQTQPQNFNLILPPNEATRYAMHYGSCDQYLYTGRGLQSSSWLSNSSQALDSARSSKPLVKYQSDGVIGSRDRSERVSFAERISDAYETAASKLRMFRQGSNEDRWGLARITREHRVLLVFVTMLSVFVFSWISWYILVLDFTYSIYIPEVVLDSLDILRFSVSFVNPILYTFFKKDFRSAFRKSLRKWSSTSEKQKSKSDFKQKFKK